jgi:hypothetical protein
LEGTPRPLELAAEKWRALIGQRKQEVKDLAAMPPESIRWISRHFSQSREVMEQWRMRSPSCFGARHPMSTGITIFQGCCTPGRRNPFIRPSHRMRAEIANDEAYI